MRSTDLGDIKLPCHRVRLIQILTGVRFLTFLRLVCLAWVPFCRMMLNRQRLSLEYIHSQQVVLGLSVDNIQAWLLTSDSSYDLVFDGKSNIAQYVSFISTDFGLSSSFCALT